MLSCIYFHVTVAGMWLLNAEQLRTLVDQYIRLKRRGRELKAAKVCMGGVFCSTSHASLCCSGGSRFAECRWATLSCESLAVHPAVFRS